MTIKTQANAIFEAVKNDHSVDFKIEAMWIMDKVATQLKEILKIYHKELDLDAMELVADTYAFYRCEVEAYRKLNARLERNGHSNLERASICGMMFPDAVIMREILIEGDLIDIADWLAKKYFELEDVPVKDCFRLKYYVATSNEPTKIIMKEKEVGHRRSHVHIYTD